MTFAVRALPALLVTWAMPLASSAAPAAYPTLTETHALALHVSAGTCPRHVTVHARTRGYEGGAEVTFRADLANAVAAPVHVHRAPGRIDFTAPDAVPFRSCVAHASVQSNGTAYAFVWRDGTCRFTLRPSRELQIMRVSSPGNVPTVVTGVAD